MDLRLPKMTGDEATARLKADPSTRDIPVIVWTAFHRGALIERAIAAGATEILHKPVHFKDMLDVVRRHLIPGVRLAAPQPQPAYD
jgi:CheY-like chemotaxis protein